MANPNEIARILNEMVSTLQDLSKKELESVEKLISEQKNLLETENDIKESKKKLVKAKKEIVKQEKRIVEEEKKTSKLKKNLLSSFIETNKKLSKVSIKIPGDKSPTIKDLLNKVSFKVVDKTPQIKNVQKRSQSLLDFERKSDDNEIQLEQLRTLREIDKKIENLKLGGASSWLDELFGNLGSVISKTIAGALGIGSGVAGAGLGGLLGGKLGKIGKVAGKGLKLAKSPVGLAVMGVGLAGTLGYKYFNDDDKKDEAIEPRQNGGPVKFGKSYLVGEDGAEVFTPKQNGFIIPNKKIDQKKFSEEDSGILDVINSFRKNFNKNIGDLISKFKVSFKDFTFSFSDKIVKLYSDIKDWIGSSYDSIKDKAINVYDSVKETISDVVDNAKKMIVPQQTKKEVVDNRVFNFNENKSGLEKFNPYKLPEVNVSPAPVNLESNYNINPTVYDKSGESDLDKKFWTDVFVPAFKNSLRVKKPETKSRYSNASNPFG